MIDPFLSELRIALANRGIGFQWRIRYHWLKWRLTHVEFVLKMVKKKRTDCSVRKVRWLDDLPQKKNAFAQ